MKKIEKKNKPSMDSIIIRNIAKIYMKLPYRPFKKQIIAIYQKYVSNKKDNVIAKIEGITYNLDLTQLIDSSIYYSGYELDTYNVIQNLCKKGWTVIDIGANIGAHTFRFAKKVGPSGKVIAIEPMSSAFKKLKNNYDLNNFKNIKLEKIGLSNETKFKVKVKFRSSWPAGGKYRIIEPQKIENDKIDIYQLDDYLRKNPLKNINLIKMDVDGYEYKVLKGSINTLKKYKPIIIMELGKNTLERNGDSAKDLISYMSNLGYYFYYEKNLKNPINPDKLLESLTEKTINVVLSFNKI